MSRLQWCLWSTMTAAIWAASALLFFTGARESPVSEMIHVLWVLALGTAGVLMWAAIWRMYRPRNSN